MKKRGKMTQSNPSQNSFMQQNERKASRTRSPRGRSSSGRTSQWRCKDCLKGLATNHFVKNGTLQNACSTRPRVFFDLGKSSHSHTVGLMHTRQKGLKRMLKKGNWQEREPVTDECHDRPGKPGKRRDEKLGQNSSLSQFSDAPQLGCAFQDMMPPKSILRKSTDMPKTIQRAKLT